MDIQKTSPVTAFPYKTTPYAHQLEALKKSCFLPYYALLCEMGTGKSKIILDNIGILWTEKKITSAIIIAPNSVYRNWLLREIPTHLPDHIYAKTRFFVHKKSDPDMLVQMLDGLDYLNIILINVESFSRSRLTGVLELFMKSTPTFMAVDESTTLKNLKSKRTKTLLHLSMFAKYRRIATGMIAPNGPENIFPQFQFLKRGCLGTSNIISFRNRYCVTRSIPISGRHVIEKTIGIKNIEELREKMDAISFRVTKEECLDLPEKTYDFLHSDLDEETRGYYDRMREEAIFELEQEDPEESIFVRNANRVNMLMRLQMITCGHIKDQNGRSIRFSSKRINDTVEFLSMVDGPVVIWSVFIQDIQDLVAAINKEFGEGAALPFYGATSNDQRDDAVNRFMNKQTRFLVINQATGRFGLTLTISSTAVYHSNSLDLEYRTQSEDRIHRIGQFHPCLYVDVLSQDTVNMPIVKTLRKKINITTAIQGDDFKQWLV